MNLASPDALAILGIFCGLAAKAFLPYIRKTIVENEPLKWQHRFSGILIICLISTLVLFPRFSPPVDGIAIFISAFSFGLTVEWTITEGYQWVNSLLKKGKSGD